ncbi:MAG: hypothetical protein AB8G95_17270 [Anaerolineae bacterium]
MSDKQTLKTDPDTPRIYQVKLKGRLDQHWINWFDGMSISLDKDRNTILSGPVRDQAELQGLIKKIYSLGLTLISVNPEEESNK